MPGIPGEQHPRCFALEPVAPEVEYRGEQRPDELEPAHARELEQAPQPGPDRREGREQPLDQVPADGVPVAAQVEPRLAVAGLLLLEPRSRELAVAIEQRPPTVGKGMAEYGGCVRPLRPWSSRWNDLIVGEAAASG